MSYVEQNLLSGENVIYQAKIHWFVFVPGLAVVIAGFFTIGADEGEGLGILGFFAIIIGIAMLVGAVIRRASTELAITSKRVIAKTGFIRRSTVELNHSKVEGLNVNQGIFGRLFNFGTVIVNGTGGGKTPIPNVSAPLAFRRQAVEIIDAS